MPRAVRCLGLFLLMALFAHSQSVSERQGRIFFTDQQGVRKAITNGNLDSQPSLSFDQQQVVFVRRVPGRTVDTGVTELWIASVDGSKPPRRVLSGGKFIDAPDSIVLGFRNPQFSPHAARVYFETDLWAVAAAIKMLDLATGNTKLLFPGLGVDVIGTGTYRGFLIGVKDPLVEDRGRTMVYWLLDPDGKEVTRIGETESDLGRFKGAHGIR
jgi:hypothetical protein